MKQTPNLCDLCKAATPTLYCPSDAAVLCGACDALVHAANFLAARHRRYSLTAIQAVAARWCAAVGVTSVEVERVAEGLRRISGVSVRVVAAAAVWAAGRRSGGLARRLEMVSGVPAKVVLRIGERIRRCHVEVEEGWAECC